MWAQSQAGGLLVAAEPGPRHSLLLWATGNVWGGLRLGAALASTSRTEVRRAERDSGRGSSKETLAQHLWLLDTEEGAFANTPFYLQGHSPAACPERT